MDTKLNDEIIQEFLKLKTDGNLFHRESQYLEFKQSFNFAGLADYYRDFAAFANNKGGYLIFGVKDRPRRELIGLTARAFQQLDKLDPEAVSGHLLEIFSGNIVWAHDVFRIGDDTFGAFYVEEAAIKPIICKKDEGKDQILRNGEVYFRYGGRTQKIQFSELDSIIANRIDQNNAHWTDLVQKIGTSGPQNAAILDTERGLIEKQNSQILMVDEDLIKSIKWIKEGSFIEKKGARTLKLIGSVQPIEQVDVIQRVRENRLKEYPLTATEMIAQVRLETPAIKQNEIHAIVRDNKLKDNKEYSTYVFRNRTQEELYENEGEIPKGIPSIYKNSVIGYIAKVFKS